jgi:hypothetical protein
MIVDLFSKRNRPAAPQPLLRDVLPEKFRVQVIHILERALGARDDHFGRSGEVHCWAFVNNKIAEEHGLLRLGNAYDSPRVALERYLLEVRNSNEALDVIELSFRAVENLASRIRWDVRELIGISQKPDDAVADLNARLDEHHLGYRYHDGAIVRLDSEFLHAEATEPALRLLYAAGFEGAEEEFRSAQAHLRHGRTKEATVDALKAFESTMKAICGIRKWRFRPEATARELIDVVLKNGLLPKYLESELTGVRAVLESAVPTVRNKTSGHGQGSVSTPMPMHLATFALHSTATNIVLLVEAHGS